MVSAAELKYFLEVAHSLNLSRASERLGISQPSLSAAIKRLEYAIGTEVILRHKKGVLLTQAGKQLLSHAKRLVHYWEEVKSQALISNQQIQGDFIFGCHPSVALHYLPHFLPELLTQHPNLSVQLKHDISRKITEGVINLTIDLGLVVNPIKHPDLIMKKMLDDRVTFWHAGNGSLPHLNFKSGKAIILCDDELSQTQWLLKQLAKKNMPYARLITSSSLEVIAHLTAAGCGIGILPGSVVNACPQKLTPITKAPSFHDEIFIIYRQEKRDIRAIQLIIRAIRELFEEKIINKDKYG